MSDTLNSYLQKIIFNIVTKITEDMIVKETTEDISFMGVWQPFTFQQLSIKPVDQRAWSWFMVHSKTSLTLKPDDVIKYKGLQYRVMEVGNYNEYGFFEYHVILDTQGAGPEVIVPEVPPVPFISDEEAPW